MISIIIPAFQQGEYLAECLESCYNQTLAPHEIIVINDGSTDNTQEVAERYMFKPFPAIESNVRVIHQVNKGLPSARNTGIMAATGQYILPLDADDILEENAIARLTNEIAATNADVIAPSFRTFGTHEETVIIQPFNLDDLKIANRLGYFSAIKRSTLIEVGGYNPRMKWGWEDWDLWFDLFKRSKTLALVQEPLVRYRIKEHSMIHDANAHSEELFAQIKKNHPEIYAK